MWFCEAICGFLTNILLFIVVILALHYVYLLSNRNYWINRGVFSPNAGSLFGNLPGQVNGKRHIMYELDELYKKYKNSHSYVGIFNFRSPRFLVLDPEIAKDILVKYFKNFQGTEFYGKVDEKSDPLLGGHMFVHIGDKWKNTRQSISPAFTNLRIKATHPIYVNVYDKMKKFIKNEIAKKNSGGLDAKDLSSRFTISVVSNSIYNVDPRVFDGSESEILSRAQSFLTPTKKFMILSLLWSLYPFLSKYVKMSLTQPGSEQFFFNLMMNSMKQREASGVKNLDYLEYLIGLKNRKEVDDMGIASHGASFLIDGYDTSSNAISAALYEMARNKRIQTKLRDEIRSKMPKEEDFTYDNIMALEYLDMVWHETLRLHNPGSYIARQCIEPITLHFPKDKKVFFDVGDVVYIPNQSIFKDPEYFENPLTFYPERFAPENGGVKAFMDQGIFFPFGLGPRNCIGNRFALAQGKFGIAALIKDFEVSLNPRTVVGQGIHPQAIIVGVNDCYLDFKEV
ncbi:probable cytochrome P450 28a5 [Chironomus tepperi]|uniref:probable cytochrome P450 28a5 n=1 Tax=Chironomus tepperi TaxID=113505 RepID=UPI00391FAE5C